MNQKVADEYYNSAKTIALSAELIAEYVYLISKTKKDHVKSRLEARIKEAVQADAARGRQLIKARDRIEKALARDASPKRKSQDPTLDLVYSNLPVSKASNPKEYKDLANTIQNQKLGQRLLDYFLHRPVPEYALGYVCGAIRVGNMEIKAEPIELYLNIHYFVPVYSTDLIHIALLQGVYRCHAEPLPSVFPIPDDVPASKLEEAIQAQTAAIHSHWARMTLP